MCVSSVVRILNSTFLQYSTFMVSGTSLEEISILDQNVWLILSLFFGLYPSLELNFLSFKERDRKAD